MNTKSYKIFKPSETAIFVEGKCCDEIQVFRFNSLNKGREIEIDISILVKNSVDYTKLKDAQIIETFVKDDEPDMFKLDEDEGFYKREFNNVNFVGMKSTTDFNEKIFDTYIFSCESCSKILKIDKKSYEIISGTRFIYDGNVARLKTLWSDLFEKGILVEKNDVGHAGLLIDVRYVTENNILPVKIEEPYDMEAHDMKYMCVLPLYAELSRKHGKTKLSLNR